MDNFFTEDYTVDDFIDAVLAAPIQEEYQVRRSPPRPGILKPKSPKRKTFGTLINELRDEIQNLKTEIELRDAYLLSMIHDLQFKTNK
jgi:hypothetical protein